MDTTKKVKYLLENFEHTRDSDLELLLMYVKDQTLVGQQRDIVLYFIENHFEFINNYKRKRAFWQNTKSMFLASETTQKERRKKEARIVEAIREEKRSFASNIYNYAKRIIRNK